MLQHVGCAALRPWRGWGHGRLLPAARWGDVNPEYVLKALSGPFEVAGCEEESVAWGCSMRAAGRRIAVLWALRCAGDS